MIAVGELHVHHPNLTQLPRLDHGTGLIDHGEAGVAVHDPKDSPLLCGEFGQRFRFFDLQRERFLADHVKPRLQSRSADLVVGAVRGGNGERLDAVLAPALAFDEARVVGVAAL